MMEGGVLVDTSVWIEFFNGLESQPVIFLKQQIIEDQPLFLCPIILQEILQGIRSDKDFEKVKSDKSSTI